jgi:hypothetical protein
VLEEATSVCGVLNHATISGKLSSYSTPPYGRHQVEMKVRSFGVSSTIFTMSSTAIVAFATRPDVGSIVLLWTQDIACPKGIATEKRFLYKRGESWTGLWSGGSSSALEGRGSSGVRCG